MELRHNIYPGRAITMDRHQYTTELPERRSEMSCGVTQSNRGHSPVYSARRGDAVCRSNRIRSRKPHRLLSCGAFESWVAVQVMERKWSPVACIGYAKRHGLFLSNEMVNTRTLYHEAWAGDLPIGVMELPEAVKQKHIQISKPRETRKATESMDLRPEIASQHTEEGHRVGDTAVGKQAGKKPWRSPFWKRKRKTT